MERWYSSLDGEHNHPTLSNEELNALSEENLSAILSSIREERKRNIFWPSLAAAAAVSIFGVFYLHSYTSTFKGKTPVANNKQDAIVLFQSDEFRNTLTVPQQVWLMDSSRIVVQPGGFISIADNFNETDRSIQFEGNGFFDIKRNTGKPFQVVTFGVITKVLGTSFHVRAPSEKDKITVIVKSGKVSVGAKRLKSKGNVLNQIVLTPNQQVTIHPINNELKASLVEHPVPIQKQIVTTVYEEEYVSKILSDLRLSYGVNIHFDQTALANCRLTTLFSIEDLYQRLNMIAKATNGSYEVIGLDIYFTSRGC